MKENPIQKNFRLAMNDLLATDPKKKHVIEVKNDYKYYPCECGSTELAGTCFRYKAEKIKKEFHEYLADCGKPQRK